jgi:hypothetical protein
MRSKFITGFRLKIIDSLERGQIVVAYDFKSPERNTFADSNSAKASKTI